MHQTEKKSSCDNASPEFQKTINHLFDYTEKEQVLQSMDEMFMEFLLSTTGEEIKRDTMFNHVIIYQHLYKIIRLAEVKPIKS